MDEGPAEVARVLLLHGEPSWSFLYRRMISPLVAAGHRVVAPDLVGFGRSDKPASTDDYTYARHVRWMEATVFDALGLDDGAAGREHVTIEGAGHFLQEDKGTELAQVLLDFIDETR